MKKSSRRNAVKEAERAERKQRRIPAYIQRCIYENATMYLAILVWEKEKQKKEKREDPVLTTIRY